MDKFWELFAESVIVQAFLAAMFGVTLCALYLGSKPVPLELVALESVILGYYFGGKTNMIARKTADHIRMAKEQEVV
jgi:hypothetical protein